VALPPRPYEWALDAPAVDLPAGSEDKAIKAALIDIIKQAAANAPRSQQTALGPSEIGHPCDRRLGHKLAGTTPANTDSDPLPSILGIGFHEWAAQAFAAHPSKESSQKATHNGTVMEWLVEQRVQAATWSDGSTLDGSGDLYWVPPRAVLDWKVLGKTSMDKLKREGPSSTYRVQLHTYGVGYLIRGLAPKRVGLVAIPRAGRLDGMHVWTEPFDPSIAAQAIQRVDAIRTLVAGAGDAALPLLERADGPCAWCPFWKPGDVDQPELGCPGAEGAKSYAYAASPRRHDDDPASLIA